MSKDLTNTATQEVGATIVQVYPAKLGEQDSIKGLAPHARNIAQGAGEPSSTGEDLVEVTPIGYDPSTHRKTDKLSLTESGRSHLIRPKTSLEDGGDKSCPSSVNATSMRGSRTGNGGIPRPSTSTSSTKAPYLYLAAPGEENSSQHSSKILGESRMEDPVMDVLDKEVELVRRRGRPKGSKNKQAKARPPPPPKRRRGRPKKTDPPVQRPVLEFPNRRQSTRISQRRSLPSLPSGRTFVHSVERSSSSNLNVSFDTAISPYLSGDPQSCSLGTRRSRSNFQLRSSSLMSGLDRAPLQPPENIFEDSNSSD